MNIKKIFLVVVVTLTMAACTSESTTDTDTKPTVNTGSLENTADTDATPPVNTGSLALLSLASTTIEEGDDGDNNLQFTVKLDHPVNDSVSVKYVTKDGTATAADNDYVPADGLLTIAPGQTSAIVNISISGDNILEGDETVILSLSNESANVTLSKSVVAGTILNDDVSPEPQPQPQPEPEPQPQLPIISVNNKTVQEGDNGSSDLQFKISLSKPAYSLVSLTYTTTDGTATVADSDYVAANGLLTITPGLTSATVTISVIGDVTDEDSETFTLTISNPSNNVVLGQSSATGLIINDEVAKQTLPELPRGIISTSGKRLAIKQAVIDNPNIAGFMVLDGWNDVEIEEGVFDWSHIDSEVARAEAGGKVVRLAIHVGGDDAPDWIFENYPEVKKVIWYDKRTGKPIQIPSYWDPVYLEIKNRFYQALGTRYKDSPAVFAITSSYINPNTGDWSFAASTDEQIQSYLDAGYTEEVFINGYKTLLDNAMSAFEGKYVMTAVGGIPQPFALPGNKLDAVDEVLDYGFATYGDRLLIGKGSLNVGLPDTVDLPKNHNWQTMLKYSPNTIGQFLWSVTDDPEFKMNGRVPYSANQIEDVFWQSVVKGKSYNLRWIEVWSIDLVNADLQDEIIAAKILLSTD